MSVRGGYILKLSFEPSFHRASSWMIIDDGDSAELNVEVYKRPEFKRYKRFKIATKIATKIDGSSSEKIHGTCEGLLKNIGNWERRYGMDGINVEGSYESQTLGDLGFSFWSPYREDLPHGLVEVVFDAVATVNSGDDWNDYFEQLRMYFDFGPQVRLLEGSPAVLRISCGLSIDMDGELRSIFAQAAQCPELVIDMGNFEGMGTSLVPAFEPLVAREGATIWRAPKFALRYLEMMGVPGERIEHIPERTDENA